MYKYKIRRTLKKNIGIDYVEKISTGKFGDVVLLKNNGEIKAGKIVTGGQIKQRQMDVWPLLDHENIIRLETTISMPDIDTCCFVMTRQYTTLEEMVMSEEFQRDECNIFDMKRWLLDVLSATDYLHKNSLCHLNINEGNILISYNSRAKLGGFRLVTSSKQPVSGCGIEFPYNPPELCYSRGEDVLVDGIGVDLWSLGIMTLRLFTQNILEVTLGNNLIIWSSEVYLAIFKEIKELERHIDEAIPGMDLSPPDLKRLQNFIRAFLALDPNERPSAELAMKHRFLSSGLFMPKTDAVWKKKASRVTIEMIIEEKNTIENVRKRCEGRDCMNPPLKPHTKHQLIQLSESNKGDQPEEVKFIKYEELSGIVTSEKSKNQLGKPLVVHSGKIISAWDRMETPVVEESTRCMHPDNLKESRSLPKVILSQRIPEEFHPKKSGTPEKKKKAGIFSTTKSWFVKKFRSFRKSNSNSENNTSSH